MSVCAYFQVSLINAMNPMISQTLWASIMPHLYLRLGHFNCLFSFTTVILSPARSVCATLQVTLYTIRTWSTFRHYPIYCTYLPPSADIATLAHYYVASKDSASWCYWCILPICPALQNDWHLRSPGVSGLAFIKEAIALPYPPDLILYVRSPSKLPPDIKSHAHVVTGSLSDKEALAAAMDGVDTVVSVLVSICSLMSVNWGWSWY